MLSSQFNGLIERWLNLRINLALAAGLPDNQDDVCKVHINRKSIQHKQLIK